MLPMCTCAVHCALNYCHERACCDETTCDCWCHTRPRNPKPITPHEFPKSESSRGTSIGGINER